MHRYEIEKSLADLFMKRYSIDFLRNPEMKEMKLLGSIGLPARELLHVYFDVKNNMGISIPEDDVERGRFDTFNHIVAIISEQVLGNNYG